MTGLPPSQSFPRSAVGSPACPADAHSLRGSPRGAEKASSPIGATAISLEIEDPRGFPAAAGDGRVDGATRAYAERGGEAGLSAGVAAPLAFSSAAPADIYRDEAGGGGIGLLTAEEGARGTSVGGALGGAGGATSGGRGDGEQDGGADFPPDDDVEDDLALITLQRQTPSRKPTLLSGFCGQILSPVTSPITGIAAWMRELGRVFGWPLLGVVMVTYGINQGYASSLTDLSLSYYWKDVQHLQPAAAQFYMSFVGIPWDVKPLYGMITDTFPILGFQRWPYIALSGIIGTVAWWALGGLPALVPALATCLLVTQSLFCAVPDVVVDGMLAQEIRQKPTYAADLQSLPSACLALASLLTYTVSGSLIKALGPCGTFFLISLSPLSLLVVALSLPEARLPEGRRTGNVRKLGRTWRRFVGTIRHRKIARAALFLFIVQGGVIPDISSGMFFWLTDPQHGPGFSEVFMGVVGAVGQVGMLLGVAAYNLWLRRFTYRSILFCTQFLLFATCCLDLLLVTRTNLRLGIPDHAFLIGDQAFSVAMARLQIMPILVLAARMCPSGIEATLFAFYMATTNFGRTCSEWWGAALLHGVGVRRESYENLWVAVVVRMGARLLPLLALGLLPEGGPESEVVEQLELDGSEGEEEEEKEEGGEEEGGGEVRLKRGMLTMRQEEQRGLVKRLDFDLDEETCGAVSDAPQKSNHRSKEEVCGAAGGAPVGVGASGDAHAAAAAAAAGEVVSSDTGVDRVGESEQLLLGSVIQSGSSSRIAAGLESSSSQQGKHGATSHNLMDDLQV
ncbi:hypothetical protein CLOM_g999 [Closterium sp. NIES-68]|nr:hypothetical protein CLOM_g999 [Closterium sp. NIES-68]GJP85064.1 hypothetical protein CLOP_g15167 [Closterium sp. NIES-67]